MTGEGGLCGVGEFLHERVRDAARYSSYDGVCRIVNLYGCRCAVGGDMSPPYIGWCVFGGVSP